MATAAALVETVVTVPVTGRGVGLVRSMVDWPSPPAAVPPTQNQAEDSAPARGTAILDAGGVRPFVAPPTGPTPPSATATPTMTARIPRMRTVRRAVSVMSAPLSSEHRDPVAPFPPSALAPPPSRQPHRRPGIPASSSGLAGPVAVRAGSSTGPGTVAV